MMRIDATAVTVKNVTKRTRPGPLRQDIYDSMINILDRLLLRWYAILLLLLLLLLLRVCV